MRSSRSTFAALIFTVVVSSAVLAPAALAMQREGPRRDDPPIVRVVRLLLKKFGIISTEEPGTPHP
jgi:hypothetical protein